MPRALTLATLVVLSTGALSGQDVGVLRVKVTLTNASGAAIPVPGHALLISDNPASAIPRRTVTASDGTATVRLLPGNYIVESDKPVALDGKSYQWAQVFDIAAGREITIELTAANAEIGDASPSSSTPSLNENAASLLLQWKDSLVSVWTPRSRATGIVVDTAGLVLTSQRAIEGAASVEVQLTPSVKVAARVLTADRARDVAVLWIDPATAAAAKPLPLKCADISNASFAKGQRLVAIGAPLRGDKDASEGEVIAVDPNFVADFRLATGSRGGPVFGAGGSLVGISSAVDNDNERARRDARLVPITAVCEVITSAQTAMQTAQRPAAARLPVEPLTPYPVDTLDAAVKSRAGNTSPYQISSADFDVAFLTPVLIRAAKPNAPQTNFGDWADYFADVPPVLAVRVTPRMAESFWATIARGAAYTQGVALPPIKHFKPGFSRLRALCGDVEVFPIHPFTLEQRVSETDAIREGLYIFDPQALGPQCASVKLVLYSEKAPDKADTRVVDPNVIQKIRQDFER